jgi:hypothetical protein
MLIAALLVGCDAIEDAQDAIDGVTNTTVVQSHVLAVQDPQDENLGLLLEGTGFEPGTSATVFLADASSADAMEDAPIIGAAVTVEGVDAPETEDGLYTFGPDAGPPYEVGATWTLVMNDGAEHRASFPLPPPAEGAVGTGVVTQAAGAPLSVNLGGRGYASAVVVVIGPSGAPTFSNQPTTIDELYEASQSETVSLVEIPGDAFTETGLHAVGVSGMFHSEADGLTDLNTVLSKVRAGQMVFTPVTVE